MIPREHLHESVLRDARVLEFVYRNETEQFLPERTHLFDFQEQARLINQVVLVERIRRAHLVEVTFKDAAHRAIPQILTEFVALEIGRGNAIVLPRLERIRRALWVPKTLTCADLLHCLDENLARFGLVIDDQLLGLVAETVAVCLQHLESERVIRDGGDLLCEVRAEKFFKSLNDLARRLAGERHSKNRMCGHAALSNDVSNAIDDCARFACARACIDEQRSGDVPNGSDLAWGQILPVKGRQTEVG